jgi:L-lactate dehydrogenase complex protein LldG
MSAGNGGGREKIIGAVRAALGARGDEPGRRGQVRARLERSPNGLIPGRALKPKPELIERFVTMLKAQGAAVREVAQLSELPQAIAEQLAEFNLPARLRHGADPVIAGLDWSRTMIERDQGPAVADDAVSLSRAAAGAAESGTLILTSGPDNPSTLNFLPETHFVILQADDLAGSYEDAWDALRRVYGRGVMPRTVNFVSGPSATADIEQTLIRGAHGPRRLAVFLVTGD